jgi:HEAT repeat protein
MLSLLTFYFGIFKFSEEYLIRIVLKEKLGSYQAIQHALAGYRLLGNAMIVAVGLYVARRMRKSHASPILVLAGTMAALLAVATATAITQRFGFFAALEIARWVGENGFYYLGIQMLLASFTGAFQAKLARKWHLFFYPIAGVPLVLLFYFSDLLMSSRQEHLLLGIVLVSLACALGSVLAMRPSLIATLYAFAASGHKAAAVIAVNALSYLRPRGYEDELDRILGLSPKKILRKHIILALGQSPERRSIDRIIHEFESDQEEIQIAVVEALQISRNYKAGQFLNRVTQAQSVRPKTVRVRINAAAGLAAMYGRYSIPFLLAGLEDEDPRIVANTLETLSGFRDRKLIPWFRQFAESSNPRVRANALMGLAGFRETREIYRVAMREILAGKDLAVLSSALYVLGRVEDREFQEELRAMAAGLKSQLPQIRRCLAWALIRLHDPLGYELFDRILTSGEARGFMHFFAQLASETRMDLVRHVVASQAEETAIRQFEEALQERTFDFHEELDFLLLLVRK